MKRFIAILCVLFVVAGVFTADARWINQTYTYFCQGHWEQTSVYVGCTYDYWGNAYPVYRWYNYWVPGRWVTECRSIWVCG